MSQRGFGLVLSCPGPETASRAVGGVGAAFQKHVAITEGGAFTPAFAAAAALRRVQHLLLDVGGS
eukprot:6046691-Alexandrium_andersonii.AAC.1